MNVHSLEMKGSFFIEKIRKRSLWKTDDSGRLLYEKDTNRYWLGGIDDWIPFVLIDNSILLNYLKIGFQINEISAENIPCEFNGGIDTIQGSLNKLISRNIGNSEISNNSIHSLYLDIDADDLHINQQIVELVSLGDLILNYDSTSKLNITIHEGLISNESLINNLFADNILSYDSTSNIQLSLNELFSSEPNLGEIHQLKDFYKWDCSSPSISQFYLGTSGVKTVWKCIASELLLFNNVPVVDLEKYLNLQQFLDSCGSDFKQCKPYIIDDIIIIDNDVDYQLIYNEYHHHHISEDPNIIYDFLHNKILIYYNGEWIDADTDCYEFADLVKNRIYIVPITNTIFYIDCDGLLIKLFDRNRI